jgi:hypothetical protein
MISPAINARPYFWGDGGRGELWSDEDEGGGGGSLWRDDSEAEGGGGSSGGGGYSGSDGDDGEYGGRGRRRVTQKAKAAEGAAGGGERGSGGGWVCAPFLHKVGTCTTRHCLPCLQTLSEPSFLGSNGIL